MNCNRLLVSIFALVLSIGSIACGESAGDANNGAGANNDGADTAQVNGRMTASQSSEGDALGGDLSAYTVTAYQVESDGTLETVSTGEAQVDAEGEFTVDVDTAAGAVSDIVLEAKNDAGSTGRVIVSETLETGDSVTSAPIDAETSVEADVYVQAKAQGSWNSDTHTSAQLRALIDAKTAAAIHESSSYESDVETTALATSAAIEAWTRAMLSETVGATQSEVDAAVAATVTARQELDASLYNASSDAEEAAAWQVYVDATAKAYADAGVSAEQRAEASHAAALAMLTYASELSAEASAQLSARAETFRARHVRAAIEAHVEAMSSTTDDQLQQVVAAGETLHANLQAAADAEASVGAEIESAWADYHSAVEQELIASFDAAAEAATIQTAVETLQTDIETTLASYEQAVGSLSASAQASAAAEAAVNAITDAHAQIVTEASAETLISAGVAQADAELIVQILFHMQLAAGQS